VFKLVTSPPPRVPTAEELAAEAEEKKRRQAKEFPTLSEILREDEWADVVKKVAEIENGSDAFSFSRTAIVTDMSNTGLNDGEGDKDVPEEEKE